MELSKQGEYEQKKKADLEHQAGILNEILDEDGEPFFDGSYLALLESQI